MKKAFIYLAMSGLLFMSSCVHELEPAQKVEWKGTGTTLKINARISDIPKTKADATRPGDDDGSYNENKVYTLDYFIFNVDPTSNDGLTEAVIKGRFTFDDGAISAKSVDVSKHFNETNNKCYVYAIANLPDASTSPDNYFEINNDGDLQQVVGSNTTVITDNYKSLQAIEVLTEFKKSLENGQFKAQKSFVMSGLSDETTLAGTGDDVVNVDLSRIASKITLDINVIKMIEQFTTNNVTQQDEYQGTWFPNVNHIQIYLNYVNPQGLVSGEHEGRKYQIGPYFSYERNAYIPTIQEGSYTSTTLARYDSNPDSPYYCGEGNEDLVGSVYIGDDGKPVFINGADYPAHRVTGTPFYSYPTTWNTSDATAPFIKIIIPWVKYRIPSQYHNLSPDNDNYNIILEKVNGFPASFEIDGITVNRITTDADMTNRYGEEFYYKISVPAFVEGETSDCALVANKWYMIKLDVAVLGSETDDATMRIDGSQMGIYVVDWSNPDDLLGGDLDGGRYLSTAKDVYVINAIDELTIPVISSHALKVVGNPTATYWTRSGGATGGSLTYNTTVINQETGEMDSTGNYFTIKTTGNSSVTLAHDLVPFSTSFNSGNAKDIAKITYTFRIQHDSDDPSVDVNYVKEITVIQYPSIYVETKASANGSVFVNGTSNGVASDNNGNSLGRVSTTTSYSTNFTIVSVSSLAGLTNSGEEPYKNWVIGEPRIKLADAYLTAGTTRYYIDKYNTNTGNRWLRTSLGSQPNYFDNYLVGNRDADNFIAPKFMLASGRGWNQNTTIWKGMAERCASYQEDGYPAGRWRMPTEAEILFCRLLGERNLIENPFDSTIGYFATSGNYINNTGSFIHDTNNHSVRCVYDLWYWGDEPVVTPGTYRVMLPE